MSADQTDIASLAENGEYRMTRENNSPDWLVATIAFVAGFLIYGIGILLWTGGAEASDLFYTRVAAFGQILAGMVTGASILLLARQLMKNEEDSIRERIRQSVRLVVEQSAEMPHWTAVTRVFTETPVAVHDMPSVYYGFSGLRETLRRRSEYKEFGVTAGTTNAPELMCRYSDLFTLNSLVRSTWDDIMVHENVVGKSAVKMYREVLLPDELHAYWRTRLRKHDRGKSAVAQLLAAYQNHNEEVQFAICEIIDAGYLIFFVRADDQSPIHGSDQIMEFSVYPDESAPGEFAVRIRDAADLTAAVMAARNAINRTRVNSKDLKSNGSSSDLKTF